MEELTFAAYLKSKKIDPKGFYQGNQLLFDEWKEEFEQMHPNSFSQQKLFQINETRREFPLKEEAETAVKKKPMMRPKIMKPKTN